MTKRVVVCFLVCVGGLLSGLAADEWFVNCNRKGGDGPGTTEVTAFTTIAAAVEKAAAGDIITVLPGTYDSEEIVDGYGYKCRVYLKKKLHLRGKPGAEKPVIVGRHDPATDGPSGGTAGVGEGAIRCVLAADGSIVEDFVLRDGAGHTSGADVYHSWAGGLVPTASSAKIYAVDCEFYNCTGNRGGAVRYVTAVRCRFEGNYGGSGQVARDLTAVNCLIVRNGRGTNYITDSGTTKFYNCTFAGNITTYSFQGAYLYNCLDLGCTGARLTYSTGTVVARNSIVFRASGDTSSNIDIDGTCALNPARPQVFAPVRDDWRVVAESATDGRGDADHLAGLGLPAGIDPYLDFDGKPIARSGAIQAGCIQTTVTPVAGAVCCTQAGTVDGVTNWYPKLAFYPAKALTACRIRPLLATNESIYAYAHGGKFVYPEMDDGLTVMPPFDPAAVATNEARITSRILYVSPSGDDDNDGKSPDRPFKTLQAAVDAMPTSSTADYESTMGVIIAAAGEYDEGGASQSSHSNRLAISRRRLRVKGAGWRHSIIRGRHDTETPGTAGDGREPLAMRCVTSSGYPSAVQGFTLADGAAGYEGDGTASTVSQQGGGAYLNSDYDAIVDCLITNCVAYRGAASYHGAFMRTRVVGCKGGNGLCRDVSLTSCLVTGNRGVLSNDNRLWQTTVYAEDGSLGAIEAGAVTTNCVARDNKYRTLGTSAVGKMGGSVLYNFGNMDKGVQNVNSTANPQFVDESAGDWRVKTTSPALVCGVLTDDYWHRYCADVDGNPVAFFDGKPLAGALQKPLQVVAPPDVNADCATLTPSGDQLVEAGQTVTWTVTDARRPPLGFATNGVPVGSDTFSYALAADASAVAGRLVTDVTYLFGTNWYVNPLGDDAADGFTAETPKGTLAGMMTAKLLDGDVVHLAEGTYSNGLMYASSTLVSNRVVVTKAITLVGDAGAEKTFISGAPSPAPEYTSNGFRLGPGAVRCVYAQGSKATFRGISFCGGYTHYLASSSTSGPCHGAGVAADVNNLFEDCVFTNNYGCRAAAAWGGTFRRCRFVDNHACTKSYGAMRMGDGTGAHYYNCWIGRNYGSAIQDVGNVVGCLFEDASYNAAGTTKNNYGVMPNALFANNIVLCGLYRPEWHFYPTNCVLTALLNSKGADYFHGDYSILTNVAAVNAELDSATRKILRRDSWLVDAGYTGYASLGGDIDLDGGQRVYNGAVDIGPFEYDWRPRYAADLAAAVTVERASPEVRETDGTPWLVDNTSMDLTWRTSARPGSRRITVKVVGDGTLTARANDGEEQVFTSGESVWMYRGQADADSLTFAFSGDGHAEFGDFVGSRGLLLMVR